MNISVYIWILFGISLVFYLMGYKPMAFQTLSGQFEGKSAGSWILNQLYSIFSNPIFLSALGISAVTSFIMASGNFSVMYVIPIVLLVTFSNIFILPSSFLFDQAVPMVLRMIIGTFLNLLMFLAIIDFVRGS